MSYLKSISIILLFIILSINGFSQKEWTLEECINYAIENNITVKRQELRADAAGRNYLQSKMEVLPSINANGTHYYNSGKAINYETYSYVNEAFQQGSVGISTEITLFNGLQAFNNIRKSKLDLLAQLENVDKAKNDITLNVATAYLQILFNKEIRDNARQQLDITLEQIEKTKRLVEIGNAAKGDLLQIEAQAAAENATLTDAENNLKLSYLDLSQLLNLQETDSFRIVIPLIPELQTDSKIDNLNDVYNTALGILPEIKSAELQVESSSKSLAISKGAISPTLSLGYQYSSRYNEISRRVTGMQTIQSTQPTGVTESGDNVYNYYSFNTYADTYPYLDQISDNAGQSVYFVIRIPIFNNWRVMNNISQAKINLSDSRLNLEYQQQNLYKSIQQARTTAIASLDRYKANLQSVESSEEAFRYTEQKYQVGMVDVLEYKTAKNNLNKAKSDLAQSKYEYIFRTKILDFYKGEQIKL